MASRLCCVIPSRPKSPQGASCQRVKHWNSTAAINHPAESESRHMKGEDTGQPLAYGLSDDLDLHRIFLSASLPDDHPDTLRVPNRKPSLDESIIRSPSFSKKLHRQLSRKSIGSGQSAIRLGKKPARPQSYQDTSLRATGRDYSSLAAKRQEDGLDFDPDALSLAFHEIRLASLQQDHVMAIEHPPKNNRNMEDVFDGHVDDQRCNSVALHRKSYSCLRSVSEPETVYASGEHTVIRRSRSISSYGGGAPSFKDLVSWQLNSALTGFDASWKLTLPNWLVSASPDDMATPSSVSEQHESHEPVLTTESAAIQIENVTSCGPPLVSGDVLPGDTVTNIGHTLQSSTPSAGQHRRQPSNVSDNSIHLYDMHISQHLRTQSQQSTSSSMEPVKKPWNKRTIGHMSLNSAVCSSAKSQHQRGISNMSGAKLRVSSGEQSTADASSSIYSRRLSMTNNVHQDPAYALPYEITILDEGEYHQSPQAIEEPEGHQATRSVTQREALSSGHERMHTDESRQDSAYLRDKSSHRQVASSLVKSSSSGSLGKLSKFQEDLTVTPTKKSRKRRSVLQLLFPKLSRARIRSNSTPFLSDESGLVTAMFDGPSDDRGLLGVPEQLMDGRQIVRSVSLNGRGPQEPNLLAPESALSIPMTGVATRSLADYELTLSASGDDRRRKSAIDLDVLRSVQDDSRPDSAGQPLRCAMPLSGTSSRTENTLMEKALHQHRLEKAALFRRSSRRSEQAPTYSYAPIFSVPFTASAVSTLGRVATGMDDLDPLETAVTAQETNRRIQSMYHLRPAEDVRVVMPAISKKVSAARTVSTSSTVAPLVSWSRFPSHTRTQRCGSAGRNDSILARDFAYGAGTVEYRGSSSPDYITPSKSSHTSELSVQKKRDWIVRSRSMTFGTVMRYYSNLFTSSAARNRRSSIATGGRLEHPELEILPPIFPAHPFTPAHRRHSSGYVGHLVDHLLEEGEHLKEEGQHATQEAYATLSHHTHLHLPLPGRASEDATDPVSSLIKVKKSKSSSRSDSPEESDAATTTTSSSSPESANTGIDDMTALDGSIGYLQSENSGQVSSARRLSRMYQAYVQVPRSTARVAEEDVKDISMPNLQELVKADQVIPAIPGREPDKKAIDLLSVPAQKCGDQRDGSVIRRFPSVTVVDDRKGHWRSISLISANSGKSLRNSTNDLLDLIKEAKNHERDKLMKTVDVFGQEAGIAR